MSIDIFSAGDIVTFRYLFPLQGLDELSDDALLQLANWFAEGAILRLGNSLYDSLHDGCSLQHGVADGCRCGSCFEWALVDENGKTVKAAENLRDFIEQE